MARFLLFDGQKTVVLPAGDFVLGRGSECHLPLDDTEVSRRHAVLRVSGAEIVVEDLESRNGVYVNGQRIEARCSVGHGDEITLGRHTLRIVEEEERARRQAMSTITSKDESEAVRDEVRAALLRDLGTDPGGVLGDPDVALSRLSPREREVLTLIARGHTQKEIAELLGVSVKTVETHRTRVNGKLGFRSRADLVRFALVAGLLDGQDKRESG